MALLRPLADAKTRSGMKAVALALVALVLLWSQSGNAATAFEVDRRLTATDDSAYAGFHDVADMPLARSDHTVTLFDSAHYNDVYGPRIYIAGGCSSDQYCSTYDQACPSYAGNAGQNVCVTCWCSDTTDSVVYYNPEVGKFTTVVPATAVKPTKRYRGQAAGLGSKLYLFGGRDLNDKVIQTIDVLETKTNTWTIYTVGAGAAAKLKKFAVPTSDGGAFSKGGLVYLVGGYDAYYNQSSYLYSIDFTQPVWNVTRLAPMPTGRGDISVQLFKGEYYVLGGWNSFFNEAVKVVESYNVETNTWTVRPDMLYERGDLAVGVMGNSLFAIAGEQRDAAKDPNGDTKLSFPVPWVSRYTVASQKFVVEAPIPVNRFRFVGISYNSSSTYLSSAIYLFGGQTDFDSACSPTGAGGKTISGCYHPLATTLKYIPVSTYTPQFSKPPLDAGQIAGIVIGALIAAGIILVAIVSYVLYLRRGYFTKQDVQLSQQSTLQLGGNSDEDGGGGEEVIELGSIRGVGDRHTRL